MESLVAQRINFIARMATSCECNHAEDKELALVWIAELSAPYEKRLNNCPSQLDGHLLDNEVTGNTILRNLGSIEE
ncbi:hypothetical protein [Xenorhabdus szentirmaii]|uniref:Uncharacterized protein n=2 Tax=Xenorhabdus szentirmaii TaxID=290112 RepID=W1J0Y1_9GAMM|nr:MULTISPECIES: hypothetical protein [Xenorhabdus]MBD2779867.1 hypothetical protein [Xenorhabdus sp. 38]MBD2800232.1 hypothetical protein [Xenorhabdus sp. M]MBD2806335.1 hypothetical protein [Xenorhabdus sp. ZM]MBD2819877.1 hypothetical protein [Xenorhabdus sp. 42]PHM30856.1 hypothetical protein Xsze_03970 [Xenorhabdus szentirmaii DSM 16338]